MKRSFRDKHEIRRAFIMQKFNSNTRIIIGVDHGYGNMLCKGKYNPDTF